MVEIKILIYQTCSNFYNYKKLDNKSYTYSSPLPLDNLSSVQRR